MKKFHLATGLMALAMLASCSQDTPEAPVPGNSEQQTEQGDGSYVALRISTEGTRAYNGDPEATKAECQINTVTVYLIEGNNVVLNLTSNEVTETDNNGERYAFFNVGSVSKGILESCVGKTLTLKVFANATSAVQSGNPAGTFNNDIVTEFESWNTTTGFLMSNSTGASGVIQKVLMDKSYKKGTETVTKSDVWVLNSPNNTAGEGEDPVYENTINVTLTRLATRFDFDKMTTHEKYNATTDEYTATGIAGAKNQNIKLKIEDFAINTHEKITNWFQKQANLPTGTTPAATVNFASSGASTSNFNAAGEQVSLTYADDKCNSKLKAQDWKTAAEGFTNLYNTYYARPHYVTKTAFDNADNNYHCCSYFVIKASFTHDMYLTTDEDDKTAPVYAYDGILLGTLKFMQNKQASFYAESTSASFAGIGKLLQSAKGSTDANFQANSKNIKGFETYTSTGGKYYTYYNKVLTNEAITEDNPLDDENVDLLRNTIYSISVKNFAGLGQNGEQNPNDPQHDTSSLLMDLDVNVKVWESNPANTNLELSR